MDNVEEKYLSECPIQEKPHKKLGFIIGDKAIKTRHIDDEQITIEKLAPDLVDKLTEKVFNEVVESFTSEVIVGRILRSRFGNAIDVTISQKILTDTFNDVYAQIREMKGEPETMLHLVVTPGYYFGEEGADISIDAVSTSGVFEHIAFYINGEKLEGAEAETVLRLHYDTHISGSATIRCEATILGVDYYAEKTITRYNSFWLGAGTSYKDIMDVAHVVPIEDCVRGAYDVTCKAGDHIMIMCGKTLRDAFIRADLNGFEFNFVTEMVTVGGNNYWVFTSENTYEAGTYNIDING